MDTLIVPGDLTASDNFQESVLYVENNLFHVMKNALESPTISAMEKFNTSSSKTGLSHIPLVDPSFANLPSDMDVTQFTKVKFQEVIVWIISNAVADDPACQ